MTVVADAREADEATAKAVEQGWVEKCLIIIF